MRIGSDSSVALRSELLKFGNESAVLIEKLFGLVALEPLLKDIHVLRLIHHYRYLMCLE